MVCTCSYNRLSWDRSRSHGGYQDAHIVHARGNVTAQYHITKDSPNCSNSMKPATQKRFLRDHQAAADLTIIRAARTVVVLRVSVRARTSTTSPTFKSLKVADPFGVVYVVLSLTLTVTVLFS